MSKQSDLVNVSQGTLDVDGGTIKLDGNYPVGTSNVALGDAALDSLTSGGYSTALGHNALTAQTTGNGNVGVGFASGQSTTSGIANVSVGTQSLNSNTTASNNTAVGYQAGYSNTTGTGSVYSGYQSGYNVTVGSYNTFTGDASGYNTTGGSNTFMGQGAGFYVTSGQKNTILGKYTGNQGGLDIRTTSNNIVLSDGDGNPRITNNSNGASNFYSQSTGTMSLINSVGAGTSTALLTGVYSGTNITGAGGTVSLRVWTNGNIQNTNNSYGALSDQKLKENIVDANSQWSDIKSLRVRNYNMIEGQTHTQIGVIAQEVETVSAGLVYESPDRDEDGNDLGTVTKSVNYSVLYMKAVKALQEEMDRIETLEAKVTALEAN